MAYAVEISGARIAVDVREDGIGELRVVTTASGPVKAIEIGGVRLRIVDQGDGTYALLVVAGV